MPKSSNEKTNDIEERKITRAKRTSSKTTGTTAKKATSTSVKKEAPAKSASKKVATKSTKKTEPKTATKTASTKKSEPKSTVKATKKTSAKTSKKDEPKTSKKTTTKTAKKDKPKTTVKTKTTTKKAKSTPSKTDTKSEEEVIKIAPTLEKVDSKSKKKLDEVTPVIKETAKKTTTKAKKKADEITPKIKEKVKKAATKAKKKTEKTTANVKKELKETASKTKKPTKKAMSTTRKKVVTKTKEKVNDFTSTFLDIVEYYDLPYRYNKTTVKVLAQDPNTLFVYWDLNDDDLQSFKELYGNNFLYITKPVLVVHNITDGYSFEIDINDFANNWYIHVNDTKCKYIVELGRRPNQNNEIFNIQNNEPTQFVKILSSNEIENPNDHVLYYENKQKLHFKNIKTNVVITKIIDNKNKKHFAEIYKYFSFDEDSNNKFDFENPSSNTPTSNVMK